MAAAVLVLLALSIAKTFALGQHERMYNNPVYRWRESLAIALSRMHTPPLHGYLAYRSIRDYLLEHGLAISDGEAKILPAPEDIFALVTDGTRMNRLIDEASRVSIDPTLQPVILKGNELGLADYFYWAFRIFGLDLSSLVLLYYSALLVSVALFFWTFRRSPFCLLLLLFYLAAHYFAVGYANLSLMQAIHNSRFFPVFSLLPSMHLLLLLLRREPPSLANIAIAMVQTFFLMFVLFCRSQGAWQALAVMASALVVVRYRDLWQALPRPKSWPRMVAFVARDTWPAIIVLCGLVGLWSYTVHAPDPRYYGAESKAHVFWHTFLVGLVSADPQLASQYAFGQDLYSDTVGYVATLHELRGRNEAPPEFTEVVDGVISIDINKSTGAYDQEARRTVYQIVADHPWLALKAIFLGKPMDQYEMLTHIPLLWDLRPYTRVMAAAFGASLLALAAGAGLPSRRRLQQAIFTLAVLMICSCLTTLIMPSPLIADVIVFYLLLWLLVSIYLPLALISRRMAAMIASPAQRPARTEAMSAPALADGVAGKHATPAL